MSAKSILYGRLFDNTSYKIKLFIQIRSPNPMIFIPQDVIDLCLERHLKMYTVFSQNLEDENYKILPPKYRKYNRYLRFIDVLLAFHKIQYIVHEPTHSNLSELNKISAMSGMKTINIVLDSSIVKNLNKLVKIVRTNYNPTNYGNRTNYGHPNNHGPRQNYELPPSVILEGLTETQLRTPSRRRRSHINRHTQRSAPHGIKIIPRGTQRVHTPRNRRS